MEGAMHRHHVHGAAPILGPLSYRSVTWPQHTVFGALVAPVMILESLPHSRTVSMQYRVEWNCRANKGKQRWASDVLMTK